MYYVTKRDNILMCSSQETFFLPWENPIGPLILFVKEKTHRNEFLFRRTILAGRYLNQTLEDNATHRYFDNFLGMFMKHNINIENDFVLLL